MAVNNKKSIPLLVMVLLLLSFFIYRSTIDLLPSFIHAWTQSERYAIALQFLQNGFDLFHPATFNLQTIDGITRVDFPINEYVVALLMKLFGTTSPFIFRMYTLSISIIGLVFLYRFTKRVTASEIKSWIVVFFVFLSPAYTYYQAGFIPCVPALSFSFIAYYFFYEYKLTSIKKYFYWSLFFFLLAALIRIPFFIFFFALLLQQVYGCFKNKKIIVHELLRFVLAVIIFAAYYRYNVHLGMLYGNMFLDRFLPAKSISEFNEIIQQIKYVWLLQYFTLAHYFLLLISLGATLVLVIRKKMARAHRSLWFNLLIMTSGAILYFFLMTCQFYDHDYYFLDSLYLPVVLLFVLSIHAISIQKKMQKIVFVGCMAMLFFMYKDSKRVQEERYTVLPWDRTEISLHNFIGTDHYLDSLGISKDAKIVVLDAYSTNIPLYLMNRKGYTVYQTCRDNAKWALFGVQWDYAVIQDVFLFSDVLKFCPIVSSVLEPIAGNGKITIYKRKKDFHKTELKQFLRIAPNNIVYQTKASFDTVIDPHIVGNTNVRYSSSFKSAVSVVDSILEYGATFNINAHELKNTSHLKVYVAYTALKKSIPNIRLVASMSRRDSTTYYQRYECNDYYHWNGAIQKNEFQFVLPNFTDPNERLSIYIWNPDKANVSVDDFELIIYK
jgi:hypothetical protein